MTRIYDEKETTAIFDGVKISAMIGVWVDNIGGRPFIGISESSDILKTDEGNVPFVCEGTKEGDEQFNRAIAALSLQYKKDNPDILLEHGISQ